MLFFLLIYNHPFKIPLSPKNIFPLVPKLQRL